MRQERCELVPVQSPAGVAVELSEPPVQILGVDLEPLLVQRRALLYVENKPDMAGQSCLGSNRLRTLAGQSHISC